MGAPVQITLYDENDEAKATYSRSIVPWGYVKKAFRLVKKLPSSEIITIENITEELLDEIADLVVSFFGNKFTREDLDVGASANDITTVLLGISARATAAANPTLPPGAKI